MASAPRAARLVASALWLAAYMAALAPSIRAQEVKQDEREAQAEANKAIARRFYENVWFSNNLEVVEELVASEYVIHDVGGLDGAREPASAQREIADFFWQNGVMAGRIDYQVASGELVATRWQWEFTPTVWWMKLLMAGGRSPIPVINVFRIRDGRIVEIWNHRHDIDVGFRRNVLLAQGFAAGVLLMLLAGAVRRWRSRRRPG